jgi:hypothetical protein
LGFWFYLWPELEPEHLEEKVFEKKTGTEVKQRLIKGLITCSGMGCLEEMGFDFQNLNQNQNWIFKKAPDLVSWFHLCVELVLELYIFFYRSELELKVISEPLYWFQFQTHIVVRVWFSVQFLKNEFQFGFRCQF